jgi:FAD/FMN-containing dehydrogenase
LPPASGCTTRAAQSSACGAAKRWVAVPRPCDPIPLPTALVDITGNDGPALERAWEETLGEGLERGWIGDAVIAASLGQSERLWRLRDCMAELRTHIAPVSRIGEFRAANDARRALARTPRR